MMKKLIFCLFCVAITFGLAIPLSPVAVAADEVNFPDPVLREAIRDAIGGGDITQAKLDLLTSFSYGSDSLPDVTDLTGMEHCTSLTSLTLYSNQISDISALSGLTSLTYLYLRANQISDISALSGLTSLTYLNLHYNQISDISALSGLTSLIDLWLHYNQISDIKPLVDNSGLSTGDLVDLRSNPLSPTSVYTYIPQLQARGVQVLYDPLPNGNTPVGSPVVVDLGTAVVTFSNVTVAGDTSATATQGNPGGPTPPNFRLRGSFVEITTTAQYSGPITVGIHYDDSKIGNEAKLRLFHWDGSQWEDVTTPPVDTVNNIIYGQVSALSPFFVGEEVGPEESGCFIATAAYGSYLDSHVEMLRDFRDSYMLTNPVGQALVSAYYEVSPPIAEFIDDHPALKPIVRVGLLPAVAMSTVAVSTTLVEKVAIVGSLVLFSALAVVWVRRRRVLP
jgi:hypothetical protein